jgi:hypothetical protein
MDGTEARAAGDHALPPLTIRLSRMGTGFILPYTYIGLIAACSARSASETELLSTSLPQEAHPGRLWRANISRYGP